MSEKITITAGKVMVDAELNESQTAKAIAEALPIQAKAQRWGGEIYFSIGVSCELQADSREVMEAGELGYWPPGTAFCIFFGPTPASQGDEIRAASVVNIVGKMKGDWSELWDVPDGADVCVEKKTPR
ncbi:MAG: cyclophilin-like fold protein [Phycisphaerae bacterium]